MLTQRSNYVILFWHDRMEQLQTELGRDQLCCQMVVDLEIIEEALGNLMDACWVEDKDSLEEGHGNLKEEHNNQEVVDLYSLGVEHLYNLVVGLYNLAVVEGSLLDVLNSVVAVPFSLVEGLYNLVE